MNEIWEFLEKRSVPANVDVGVLPRHVSEDATPRAILRAGWAVPTRPSARFTSVPSRLVGTAHPTENSVFSQSSWLPLLRFCSAIGSRSTFFHALLESQFIGGI